MRFLFSRRLVRRVERGIKCLWVFSVLGISVFIFFLMVGENGKRKRIFIKMG